MFLTIITAAHVWVVADRPQGMQPHDCHELRAAFAEAFERKGEPVEAVCEFPRNPRERT